MLFGDLVEGPGSRQAIATWTLSPARPNAPLPRSTLSSRRHSASSAGRSHVLLAVVDAEQSRRSIGSIPALPASSALMRLRTRTDRAASSCAPAPRASLGRQLCETLALARMDEQVNSAARNLARSLEEICDRVDGDVEFSLTRCVVMNGSKWRRRCARAGSLRVHASRKPC